MEKVTETTNVTIRVKKEKLEEAIVTGNTLVLYGQLYEEFRRTKERYEANGYTITAQDPIACTFTAERESEI